MHTFNKYKINFSTWHSYKIFLVDFVDLTSKDLVKALFGEKKYYKGREKKEKKEKKGRKKGKKGKRGGERGDKREKIDKEKNYEKSDLSKIDFFCMVLGMSLQLFKFKISQFVPFLHIFDRFRWFLIHKRTNCEIWNLE